MNTLHQVHFDRDCSCQWVLSFWILEDCFYFKQQQKNVAALLLLRELFSTSCLPCRVNVGCGPAEERVLLTGLHAVADIYCENCKTTLGWKYVSLLKLSPEPFTFPVRVFLDAPLNARCCVVAQLCGFLACNGTNDTGQRNKVALIKALLVKAMVTLFFAQGCI